MKIMLDAGHGYSTPGKHSPGGMREYEFNRQVAICAKERFGSYQNVSIYFSHEDGRDVPLQERTNLANRLQVDVFVSIHANAYGTTWNDAGGIETYVYPTRPKEAVQLAEKIQNHLVAMTGMKSRGVKTADFHVLRETKMTAVLAECGFMTNRAEEGLMHKESFHKTCAEAIVKGIAEQYHLLFNVSNQQTGTSYTVQAGAFSLKANADRLVQRLNGAGFAASVAVIPPFFKVLVGTFSSKSSAEDQVQRLRTSGFAAFFEQKK